MKNQRGFTLLELLVVMAIIGILASLAAARYQSHIVTANRQAAVASLQLAQQSMERYFLRNNKYDGASIAHVTARGYTLTISSSSDKAFVLSATPDNTDAQCGTLTLSESNARTPANNDCWR